MPGRSAAMWLLARTALSDTGKKWIRVIIGDNSRVLDDSIVPSDTVIPPNCLFGGKPGIYILHWYLACFIEELHESTNIQHREFCQTYFNNFKPKENWSIFIFVNCSRIVNWSFNSLFIN